MKKLIALIIATAVLASLYAHSASEVKAEFNDGTKILSVTYSHSVKDPSSHYIEEVTVDLNGKEIISQKLIVQDDNKNGSVLYKIPDAKAGDKIEIKTKCSKFGSKGFKFTVEKTQERAVKEVKQAIPEKAVPQKLTR